MFLLFLFSALLAGCNLPVELQSTATALVQATAAPADGWQTIDAGLAWRTLTPNGDDLAQIVVVRINPQRYQFRAHYRAGDPQSLASWRTLKPNASVIINANFFDTANRALGLVVSDGIANGAAYRDRGGTFLVRNGEPEISTFRTGILNVDASVEQAIQGFPVLVENGQQAYFSTRGSQRTRRTVIGEDKHSNILIMVSPFLGLSLADLSAWLSESDLDIVTAINLDGGGSTMIAIPAVNYLQPAFDLVPTILAVFPK